MRSHEMIFSSTVNNKALSNETVLHQLTGAAWTVVHTAFWNGKKFNPEQVQQAQSFIHSFLQQNDSPGQTFEEFIQRILLVLFDRCRLKKARRSNPASWFNEQDQEGFAYTERSYRQLIERRKTTQGYRSHLRDFAWAVWYNTPGLHTPKNFHQWRSYYAEKSQRLLNLYLATLANMGRMPGNNSENFLFALK